MEVTIPPEKELFVKKVKFKSKLQIFLPCQVCKKRINYDSSSSMSVKCHSWATHQQATYCKREATVNLCLMNKDTEEWVTAFTLEALLHQVSSATLLNSTVDVAETLMGAENINIYNDQTSFVTKMECLPKVDTCTEDTCDDIPEEANVTTQH